MTSDQVGFAGGVGWRRRIRYLIDILILVAISFALPIAFSALYMPQSMRSEFVFAAALQLLGVAIGCLLVRLRGERLADIGLKWPENWGRTFLISLAAAVLIFVTMYLLERAGFRRDLSRFKAVQGDLGLAVYGVVYAFIGAGFYEEFMFRGFLFQGLAMFFGGTRIAWIAACTVQGALFGAAHFYQNPLGVLITGTLGMLMGFLFLASGRNLWPLIIGHGIYDASRFVLFYFQGPPVG